ncbi:MAG: 7TM receptor with intracellular metal dependent phosphohydrolase [Desulfotomaculum sp. 46_296]|nr:MAG: 7TM receptor with intracellular metal dependent phosphohydrolase [Desulfotomaculum sp. 46_296]KUK84775.1 MAG: 7TM receptor with intracellular metal dependent phosphohydrolase [Desulfofundulus kuznetsovii]HAU32366.1 phosphohydrolase [Desulfotomaculum sp.]
MLATIFKRAAALIMYLLKQRQTRRGIAAFLFFALTTMLLSIEIVPYRISLREGQVSSKDIFAPRNIVFIDQAKTEILQEQAASAVRNQYDRDALVSGAVQNDIARLLAEMKKIQSDTSAGMQDRLNRLRKLLPANNLPVEILAALAAPSQKELQLTEQGVNGLISQAMDSEQGITQVNLEDTKSVLEVKIRRLDLTKPYEELGVLLMRKYLRPNTFLNVEKTRLLREEAKKTVPIQQVTVIKGEKIVGAGEIVQADQIAKLEALGLTRSSFPWRTLWGNALLVLLLMVVVLFYLFQQNKEIYQSAGHLYLLVLIIILVIALAKAIVAINSTQWPEFGALFGYMAPVAAAGMLIAILLDSRLGVLIVAILSFLLMLMSNGQLRFGIVGMVSGLTGIYSVSKLSKSGDLIRAGLYTGLASICAIGIMEISSSTPFGIVIASAVFFGITNGIISSILTIGILPYLESTFGITSSVRLLELSYPGNPLLKRLLTEAPGTYHHSILVGNLAEAAAEAINGNRLLTRVGAYYHDVGKLKRPYFFIENQMNTDNPHDKIAPTLSTLILTFHVKDGVELAREYKLPEDIINIIEQHHGNGLCTYFYHKALENGQNEGVAEEEFRYDCPKPQTREAALVMLADSVEAAVRSLQNRTYNRVEGMVHRIVKDKLLDGQLDECDLTFKDLDVIASAFIQVLSGIFHARIEYPDLSKEVEGRKTKGAGVRKQFFRARSK